MEFFPLLFSLQDSRPRKMKMKSKCSQNKISMERNNWSKLTAEAATSQSSRILGRIQGRREINFFSKTNSNPANNQLDLRLDSVLTLSTKSFSSFPSSNVVLLCPSNTQTDNITQIQWTYTNTCLYIYSEKFLFKKGSEK